MSPSLGSTSLCCRASVVFCLQFSFNAETVSQLEFSTFIHFELRIFSQRENNGRLGKMAVVPQKLLHHLSDAYSVPVAAAGLPLVGELMTFISFLKIMLLLF